MQMFRFPAEFHGLRVLHCVTYRELFLFEASTIYLMNLAIHPLCTCIPTYLMSLHHFLGCAILSRVILYLQIFSKKDFKELCDYAMFSPLTWMHKQVNTRTQRKCQTSSDPRSIQSHILTLTGADIRCFRRRAGRCGIINPLVDHGLNISLHQLDKR